MNKVKADVRMYKDFFAGYIKYRKNIKESSKWMGKYAKAKGIVVNPNKMYLTNLKIWIAENEEIYGQRICPCFEATGDKNMDRELLCPCSFAAQDIEDHGTCHCNLFGKADLTDMQWQTQQKRIMKEYRIPLKIENRIVDTRGVDVDKTRGMDVPDPVHQLKQSLNQLGTDFKMIVSREKSAQNIVSYCKMKKIEASYQERENYFIVNIDR